MYLVAVQSVADRPPERGHRIGEIRLLHERIRPQGRHQLLFSDQLPGPIDELDQEIECLRSQRYGASLLKEEPLIRLYGKRAEFVERGSHSSRPTLSGRGASIAWHPSHINVACRTRSSPGPLLPAKATSGGYEKFFWAEGRTYSHIVDPRTGYPAQGTSAVSVLAPRTIDSEAWTKPFFINGRAWASAHKPAGFRVFFCEDRPQATCGWLP